MARRKDYRETKKTKGSYDYGSSAYAAKTVIKGWTDGQEGSMRQESNGSMDYYEKKGSLDREDTNKLERSNLPQM